MLGLATRLIAGMVTPLVDQLSTSSARLLRKLALFVAAGLCLIVVVIALTIAFDLWIASMKGPIVGALAVAGLYFAFALIAIALALRKPKRKPTTRTTRRKASAEEAKAGAEAKGLNAQIDAFAAPLVAVLQRFGLRREQLAVLAGASVAKQVGPVPLVGLAIISGFLVGRMWGGWRALLGSDLVASLLASDVLAAFATPRTPPTPQPEDSEDA